jgi:hypothetical protein
MVEWLKEKALSFNSSTTKKKRRRRRKKKIGVLNPRPKLLGFHMPVQATCTYTPNKQEW